MYILVRDDLPIGRAINYAAHAAIKAHMLWGSGRPIYMDPQTYEEDQVYHDWLNNSFKKVTCKVTPKVFDEAKDRGYRCYIWKEPDEYIMIIHPQHSEDKWLKYLTLYK